MATTSSAPPPTISSPETKPVTPSVNVSLLSNSTGTEPYAFPPPTYPPTPADTPSPTSTPAPLTEGITQHHLQPHLTAPLLSIPEPRRVELVEPEVAQKKDPPRHSTPERKRTLRIPGIALSAAKSVPNMRRAFSRRKQSGEVPRLAKHVEVDGEDSRGRSKQSGPPITMHSRGHSMTYSNSDEKLSSASGGLKRSLSRREKIVRAITNPDTIFRPDPDSPPPESRFNPNPNSRLIQTFFSNSLDVAPGHLAPPTPPSTLPDADIPLFNTAYVSPKVSSDLPAGYTIRPLCRQDYHRGYMDVVRVLGKTGWVSEDTWDQRINWLRGMGDTYFICVILDEDGMVVASGTLLMERKFIHSMGTVAHIQDLAVARNQKGKKMGLRVLEALVYAANEASCYKILVHCTEANEAFHAQCGFVRDGSSMVLPLYRRPAAEPEVTQ